MNGPCRVYTANYFSCASAPSDNPDQTGALTAFDRRLSETPQRSHAVLRLTRLRCFLSFTRDSTQQPWNRTWSFFWKQGEAARQWPIFSSVKTLEETYSAPPFAPICQHQILMLPMLLGFTCTPLTNTHSQNTTLHQAQHSHTQYHTWMHTHPARRLTKGRGRCHHGGEAGVEGGRSFFLKILIHVLLFYLKFLFHDLSEVMMEEEVPSTALEQQDGALVSLTGIMVCVCVLENDLE